MLRTDIPDRKNIFVLPLPSRECPTPIGSPTPERRQAERGKEGGDLRGRDGDEEIYVRPRPSFVVPLQMLSFTSTGLKEGSRECS